MSKPASTPFIHTLINDLGAAAMLPNIMLGEELGLYRAMADGQPVPAHHQHRRVFLLCSLSLRL